MEQIINANNNCSSTTITSGVPKIVQLLLLHYPATPHYQQRNSMIFFTDHFFQPVCANYDIGQGSTILRIRPGTWTPLQYRTIREIVAEQTPNSSEDRCRNSTNDK